MKKRILISLTVIALLIGADYLFIPNIVNLKTSANISATRTGLHRSLLDKDNVAKWWPGKVSNDSFYFNDLVYTINNSTITVLPVEIANKNTLLTSSLFLIEISKEAVMVEWVSAMVTSYNPFKRLQAYYKAKKIEADMSAIINKMKSFYDVSENIYGFNIKKELVMDSILIQTSDSCKGIPNNQFIYGLIDKLREYAASQSVKQTGYPMLNIFTNDSINFVVKVALPLNHYIPSTANILQKRMLGMGNILVTEVKGGNAIGSRAFEQIKIYADDYQRLAPAIPFYSLITDRIKEPDSTKWVTKIYFPVM